MKKIKIQISIEIRPFYLKCTCFCPNRISLVATITTWYVIHVWLGKKETFMHFKQNVITISAVHQWYLGCMSNVTKQFKLVYLKLNLPMINWCTVKNYEIVISDFFIPRQFWLGPEEPLVIGINFKSFAIVLSGK